MAAARTPGDSPRGLGALRPARGRGPSDTAAAPSDRQGHLHGSLTAVVQLPHHGRGGPARDPRGQRGRDCARHRHPLLAHAPAGPLSPDGRFPDHSHSVDRAAPRAVAGFRDRAQADGDRPCLVLSHRRDDVCRLRGGGPRPAEAVAHLRRRPAQDVLARRASLGAPWRADRNQDRGRGGGDRRGVRRARRIERRPGLSLPAVRGPAADAARLRRGRDPVAVCRGTVCPAQSGGTACCSVGSSTERRTDVIRRLAIPALVLTALGLAACGEKKAALTGSSGSTQSLTLMLDWFPNADHVGLYQALAEGDFARAGLDVHVQVPSDPASPLELVHAGKVDMAISYEPELLLARNRGLPLVSVAAIAQQPLTSIMSIGSKHITSVRQLRGKRVGDAGISYQHAYLDTILS